LLLLLLLLLTTHTPHIPIQPRTRPSLSFIAMPTTMYIPSRCQR
jgi:hypothetical protein